MKIRDSEEEQIRQFMMIKFPLMSRRVGIDDEESLINSGVIDSLGVLDLVTFLEKEFEITGSDDDLVPKNFESIAGLASFVRSKCNSKVIP